MKKSLLQITQQILSDMDAEEVNSLSDSVEAMQVATIVEEVYYGLIATRTIPEHAQLLKLTSLSDTEYPTHFTYPDNVKEINYIWYQDSDGNYREIDFVEPLDFIWRLDNVQTNYVAVKDKEAGTTLRISNDKQPQWFTSFDDFHIVMDSYEADIDTTLQESKTRAYGTKYPTFSKTDEYVPDIDATMFPYLIAEASSTAQSLLKGGADQKTEQRARRQKSYIQNDMYRTERKRSLSHYGR